MYILPGFWVGRLSAMHSCSNWTCETEYPPHTRMVLIRRRTHNFQNRVVHFAQSGTRPTPCCTLTRCAIIFLRTPVVRSCCAIIFLRTYPAGRSPCCALTRCALILLYAYPAVPLFFCALTQQSTYDHTHHTFIKCSLNRAGRMNIILNLYLH